MIKDEWDILGEFIRDYRFGFHKYCISIDAKYDFHLRSAMPRFDSEDNILINIISTHKVEFIRKELEKIFNITIYYLSKRKIYPSSKQDITTWYISKNDMENIMAICRIFSKGN